jgi:hypothetical protein
MQVRGSKAGGALHLSLPCKSSVVIPGSPSARQRTSLVRLTRGLKLNTGQWLLRFSVLREPPMTSILSIPFQNLKCYQYSNNPSFSTVIPWREKNKISMTLLIKNSGTGGKAEATQIHRLIQGSL